MNLLSRKDHSIKCHLPQVLKFQLCKKNTVFSLPLWSIEEYMNRGRWQLIYGVSKLPSKLILFIWMEKFAFSSVLS